MFKDVKRKIGSLLSTVREKAAEGGITASPVHRLVRDNRGNSELVAVIALIAVVLVVAVVYFMPVLKDYFQNTVPAGMKTATQNIFNFKG